MGDITGRVHHSKVLSAFRNLARSCHRVTGPRVSSVFSDNEQRPDGSGPPTREDAKPSKFVTAWHGRIFFIRNQCQISDLAERRWGLPQCLAKLCLRSVCVSQPGRLTAT
eukprot:767989-Hanusia_phi.AAC.3